MSDAVRPQGWNNWNDPVREKTVRYAEYGSSGPGASAATRVPWAHALTVAEAKQYTVEAVLGGIDGWNPMTGTVRQAIRVTRAARRPRRCRPRCPCRRRTRVAAVGPDGVHHAVWAARARGDRSIRYSDIERRRRVVGTAPHRNSGGERARPDLAEPLL